MSAVRQTVRFSPPDARCAARGPRLAGRGLQLGARALRLAARARRRAPRLLGLTAVLCVGCSASGSLERVDRLDEATGATVSSARAPLVFARTESRYSVSGRDYLYLGPVETNRQGVHDYFLWVGIGTTLDRGFLAPQSEAPKTLYLQVRGEWMELELRPWRERMPRLELLGLYRTAVETRAELAARVTSNQLDLMAHEQIRSIRVVDASGHAAEYLRWDRGPTWPGFVAASGP